MSFLQRSLIAFVAMHFSVTSAFAETRTNVGLEAHPNFCNLGGYRTADGRTLQTGMVFRSGELPRTTDADLTTLEELGIRTVVNFLPESEIESRAPDRLPSGIREISLPLTGDVNGITDAANTLVDARNSGDFHNFPPEFNPLAHEELVGGLADAQYAELFKLFSDEASYPIVFHCSHGIHRTGTAAALVFTALGVPWETVRQDYLLSNTTRADEVAPRILQINELAKNIEMSSEDRARNAADIDAFYLLEAEYIDASRSQATERFGGAQAYIEQGLD